MNTQQIKKKFNRAAKTYEAVANEQKQSAIDLVDHLFTHFPTFSPQSILDIGTGTGFIPEILTQKFPNSLFLLNDIASEMIQYCQKKFVHQHFQYFNADMDSMNIPQVELITANFSLQWSNQLYTTIENLFQKTKILAFNCLLSSSFQAWRQQFPRHTLMNYPNTETLMTLIRRLDPHAFYMEKSYPISANSPLNFMRFLQKLGASSSLHKIPITHLKKVIAYNTKIDTHYHVLFVIMENQA